MLIVGAGGLFLQLVDDLEDCFDKIILWADSPAKHNRIQNKFNVLATEEQVLSEFSKDNKFILAVGSPQDREKLAQRFIGYGGELESFISPKATVSKYATIEKGCVILHGAIIEADAHLGKGCLINAQALITHGCQLGNFVEIGPGAVIAGQVKVANSVFVGSNATILPKISIGANAVIGGSSLVRQHVAENNKVAGVPAKKISK